MLKKGDKKLINAWAFYDWANSVYSLVISSAIFPLYYGLITNPNNEKHIKVSFLYTEWDPTVLYDYILATSYLIVAFVAPILSGITDYTGNKLANLKRSCLIGGLATMGLYFFKGESSLWIGILFTFIGSIGYWLSIVFYNSYLPEVAFPEQQDRASGKGFIYGYIGAILSLVICLIAILTRETGAEKLEMMRWSFVFVGIWWIAFAQITYKKLPNFINKSHYEDKLYIWKGLEELKTVLKSLKNLPRLKYFLIAFLFCSVGVQTIILMAGMFGSQELHLPSDNLIISILIVQGIAILGVWIFGKISDKKGNIFTLKLTVLIWMIVCFVIFSIDKNSANIQYIFYAMAGLIGLVLGAIQSLSRSTYSKLLPETQDNTTYFSFFDFTEKIAIVIGMFSFGLLKSLTGSMQYSVLSLAIFFLIAFFLLSRLKNKL